MRRRTIELGFSCALGAVFLWSFVASFFWDFRAALFPAVIGALFLFLTLLQIFRIVFPKKRSTPMDTTEIKNPVMVQEDERVLESHAGLSMIVGWLGGYFLGIVLLGFELSTVVFFVSFMQIFGREKWWVIVVCTFFAWIIVRMFFVEFLHVPFSQGWLIKSILKYGG